MAPGRRLFGERERGRLRRVSPERARAVAPRRRRAPLEQAAEKATVGVLAVAAAVGLVGTGVGLDARGWVGLSALLGIFASLYQRYLLEFRRELLASLPRTVAVAAFLLLPTALARLMEPFFGLGELAFLPLPLLALTVALIRGRAVALEGAVLSSVLVGLHVVLAGGASREALSGLAVAVGGAVVAALAADEVKRRSSLVRIGVLTGLAMAALEGAFLLIGPAPLAGAAPFGRLALLAVAGILSSLLVSGLLPALETLFSATTDISLLELGNTHEHPLLRKLLLEAPGTFHHSYIVGLLAEAAAEAVGANALLARVGALFHDVGKLNKPEYFAENSHEARGRHEQLTPELSMLIISAHPRDGVELGRYYGLPQCLLDFMPEHHGTLLVGYFYERAKALRGAENVSEASFRYPGPKPHRIETAIVMIADAVEAISRQMPDPTQARLREMVHEVAVSRLMDGQFDECPLRLVDLAAIEDAFVRVLMAIHHTRPTFPKGPPHPLDLSRAPEERRAAQVASGARSGVAGRA